MDVFQLRNRLVEDYSSYIRSFIQIRDERIHGLVDQEISGGLLWPDPLIQLNPSFRPGKWIDELVDVLLALRHLGWRPGKRLLVSGGGGGLGANAADLAALAGLEIPALNRGTGRKLTEILTRAGAVVSNPLDIGTPLLPLPMFEAAMQEAANNPSTDVLLFDLAMNFALRMAGEEGLYQVADVHQNDLPRVQRP